MSLSAFNKPQKLLDRAERSSDYAYAALRGFFASPENAAIVHHVEPESGDSVRKAVVLNPLPDTIEESVTNSINNVRNAFDQILFAACKAITRPITDGHYPWCADKIDLGWKFKNKKTGKERIPKELWDTLAAQQPYPRDETDGSGDTFLRAMAAFANRKHTIGIDIGCSVSGHRLAFNTGMGSEKIVVPSPRWDPVKNEVELVRWRGREPSFADENGVSFYITFDTTAPEELRGVDAIGATTTFRQAAQRALDALKARTIELGFS